MSKSIWFSKTDFILVAVVTIACLAELLLQKCLCDITELLNQSGFINLPIFQLVHFIFLSTLFIFPLFYTTRFCRISPIQKWGEINAYIGYTALFSCFIYGVLTILGFATLSFTLQSVNNHFFIIILISWLMFITKKNLLGELQSWRASIKFVIPFLISLCTLLAIPSTSVPFITIENFNSKLADFEAVASMVKSGVLKPSEISGDVVLPCKYSYLAAGGDKFKRGSIRITKADNATRIYFHRRNYGFGDSSDGFVYRSDNQEVGEKLSEHWFFTRS